MRLDEDGLVILASVALLGAAWWWFNRDDAQIDAMTGAAPWAPGGIDLTFDLGDTLNTIKNKLWTPPEGARPYLAAIAAAEAKYSLPENLLARLLHQESRYRQDIITGKVKSAAGAIGIAQFMPATARDFGINPLDPFQSIDAAGKYLKQLYGRFGNWEEALAAYNWGQGNVSRKGLAAAPTETRNYFSQILSDLGLA